MTDETPSPTKLSRRERQIMDLLYRGERLTAAEIQQALPDPPGYSAVRAMLATLEKKGHIRHESEGVRYVYFPVVAKERATQAAVRHLLQTFFMGSAEQAVATLLDVSRNGLSADQLDRMALMIENARKEGR